MKAIMDKKESLKRFGTDNPEKLKGRSFTATPTNWTHKDKIRWSIVKAKALADGTIELEIA